MRGGAFGASGSVFDLSEFYERMALLKIMTWDETHLLGVGLNQGVKLLQIEMRFG